MARQLIIPVDVFRRGVLVFIGSQQELMEYIRKKDQENLTAVAHYLEKDSITLAMTIKTSTDAIIFAEQMPSVLTFIHEAYHAAHAIYQIIGIDPSDEEAYAYLIEYICKQIFAWLNVPCDIPSQ